MASVMDVAAYIVEKHGPMSAMKLQKLVYYSQAWALAWTDAALFEEPIEAWASGPVVRSLYNAHRGLFTIKPGVIAGNPTALTEDEKDVVGRVLEAYGDKSPQWLSDLTHIEQPWIQARAGLEPGERGEKTIPLQSMQEYYANLPSA